MSEPERKQIIAQILTYPANMYSREFLDGPHPKTNKPYTNAELKTYLEELQQSAKPVRNQTVVTSAEELYRQEQVSFEFLIRHKDFNNCAANIGLIKDYFAEHRLDWTKENLEKAFLELKSKFAPVLGPVVDTPQPLAPEPPEPPEPPVPPVPVAPVQPTLEPSGLTMQEINSWDGPTMRKKMQNPAMRKQIDAVLAAEAELQRLARQQDARQQMRENQ